MASRQRTDGLLRIVLLVIAVVLLAPLLTMGMAMPMMGMWGGMTGGVGGAGFSPLWGLGMTLLWLVVLVGGGYLVYRVLADGEHVDPALEELRLAYARGDLSADEFEERLSRLGED